MVTKLWINGRDTEDREEWCEEVRLHCEKCYDDKSETSEKKLSASEYSDAEMTARLLFKVGECRSQSIEYFVRAGRCYVANPMARLTTEVICEVTHWFHKRFQWDCRAAEAPGVPQEEKGLFVFRAIALLCVFSKLCTTVLVDLLHEEKGRVDEFARGS